MLFNMRSVFLSRRILPIWQRQWPKRWSERGPSSWCKQSRLISNPHSSLSNLSSLASNLSGSVSNRPESASNLSGSVSNLPRSDTDPNWTKMKSVRCEGRMLVVEWADGSASDAFPLVYLRDNRLENFNSVTNSRISYINHLDCDVTVADVTSEGDGQSVEMTWGDDGVRSSFSGHWLREHSFSKENRMRRRYGFYKRQPNLWDSKQIEKTLPTFPFALVLEDDRCLHDFLLAVEEVGLIVLTDTPKEHGQVDKLGERIPFIKETHYGRTFFVRSKGDAANNEAYTNKFIPLHMDLPTIDYAPEVQVLHCIRQSVVGGTNLFSDGFEGARLLLEERPDYYKILTETMVDWADVNRDYFQCHMWGKHYIIQLDMFGEVEKINLNSQIRTSYLDMDVEEVERFYRALVMYEQILYRPEVMYRHRLNEGQVVVFNNTRVLHGREAYEGGPGSSPRLKFVSKSRLGEEEDVEIEDTRVFNGCYFDLDQIRSLRRVLSQKLGYTYVVHTNYK